MNIAVDFDGVITMFKKDYTTYMDGAMKELFAKYKIPCYIDTKIDLSCLTGITIYKRYGFDSIPAEIEKDFEYDTIKKYSLYSREKTNFKDSILVKNCGKYLKKLYDAGHTLILTTARGATYKDFTDTPSFEAAKQVLNALENRYGFKYKEYHGGHESKSKIYSESKIDIVIDDSIYHCVEAAEKKMCAIHLTTSKNNFDPDFKERIDANKEYIHKAKNWKEIYKIITSLQQ